jgi:hypothetical protein
VAWAGGRRRVLGPQVLGQELRPRARESSI